MRNKTRTGMKYQKLTPDTKRSIVNARRRKGDTNRIAEELDYSVSHVTNVLAGRHENSKILNRAYDLTRNRELK